MDEEEKESSLVTFYYNHKILIWIIIILIAIILIVKLVTRNNGSVVPPKDDISIVIEQGDSITLGLGNTTKLNATVNVSDPVIHWTSSDTSIAVVTNGNVTGVNYGTAIITALYFDNDGNKYNDSCKVTIIEGDANIALDGISFPEGDLYMPVDSVYQLNLMLSPTNALISDKEFVSTEKNVATVSSDGLIKAVSAGYTSIIATVNGKYKTSIDVYVSNDYDKAEILVSPTSLSFNVDTRKLKVGSSEKLSYSIVPSNADRSKLTWASSNPNVVSIDQNGNITANNIGISVVSVSSINGIKASMVVEVESNIIPVKDIIISKSEISMKAGTTEVITPQVSPSNASNQGFNFASNNPIIVSVTPNASGTSATLSALHKGTTVITIKSGEIVKRIVVTVTGSSNNSEIDEDDDTVSTNIRVKSDKNNLASTYQEATKIPVSGATNVTISMDSGVSKIKYCYGVYGQSLCTPNITKYNNTTVVIPSGAMYILRIIKYDHNDVEIPSTSQNYTDGALNYYINTKSTVAKLYSVFGAYDRLTTATLNPSKIGNRISITVDNGSRYLMVCSSVDAACNPSIRVNNNYAITISKNGTTRVYVAEYDVDGKKIGNTEVYYAYVHEDNSNTIDNGTSSVTASKLGVYNQASIGKYLSVDIESSIKINNVRFCYIVVDKNATGTCNLDLKTTSVPLHDGSTYFHPQEELKTYYGTFNETNKTSLLFDIDGLDTLYNTNDTTKDVILEFAVKSSKGYSKAIKVRMNMYKKEGTSSYWDNSFIK